MAVFYCRISCLLIIRLRSSISKICDSVITVGVITDIHRVERIITVYLIIIYNSCCNSVVLVVIDLKTASDFISKFKSDLTDI